MRDAIRAAITMLGGAAEEAEACVTAGNLVGGLSALAAGTLATISHLTPHARPGGQEQIVTHDPEVLFGPPYGTWREIAPGIDLRVFATDEPGTFRISYRDRMLTPYPHVLLVLSNGSTLRTVQNTTGDIAGLINAGEAVVYQVTDLDGITHNVRVAAVLDFYEVTGP